MGKNVDYVDFTIEASAFHIEEYFENMGWVSIATIKKHAYPRLIKDNYKNMVINPRSDDITSNRSMSSSHRKEI